MLTRRFWIALATLGLLAGAAGGLLLWRVPLAQALLDAALAAQALPAARATVAEITAGRLRLTDLAAGTEGEAKARALSATFSLGGLLDGRLEALSVEGAALRLDLRGGAAPFGSLQPVVERLQVRATAGTERPFSVPSLRLDGARIEAETDWGPAALDLGGGYDPKAQRAEFAFSLSSPFGDLAGAGRAEGDPRAFASARLDLTGGPLMWPGAALRLESLAGEIDLAAGGGASPEGRIDLQMAGLSLAGTRFDAATLEADASAEAASLEGRLASDDGSAELALTGRLRDLAMRPAFKIELTGKVTPQAGLWALAPLPFRISGATALAASAAGQLPPLLAKAEALPAWLAAAALSGRIALSLTDLAAPEIGAALSADLDAAAVWAAGELSLTTRRTNRLSLTGAQAAWLTDFGLPPALAGLLGQRVELALPAAGGGTATIVWRPGPSGGSLSFDGSAAATGRALSARLTGRIESDARDGRARARIAAYEVTARNADLAGRRIARFDARGTFDGTPDAFTATSEVTARLAAAALGDFSADTLELQAPLQLSRDGGPLALRLAAPGRLTLTGLGLAGRMTSSAPVSIRIREAEAKIDLGPDGLPAAIAQQAALSLGDGRFDIRLADGPPLALRLEAPEIRAAGLWRADGPVQGELSVKRAGASLPDRQLALEGISADLAMSETLAARFSVDALRHLAEPAYWAPLRLAGTAQLAGTSLAATARASGPAANPLAEVTARHDLADGSGGMEARLMPLDFAPNGLQPADLSPLLAALTQVSGRATGAAALAWDAAGLSGTAAAGLAGLGFTYEEAKVAGLDLDLALDGLTPPTSPPGQRLHVATLELGTRLSDLEARFSLPPGKPGQLLIEAARFDMAGGRFAVRESPIDLTAERQSARLKVESLDLERLFATLAIAGLEGRGELAGTIPLAVQGNLVSIEGARLEATAPGILRFRNPTALATLSGQDANLDQMLKALENFHFERLSVTGALDEAGNLNFLIALAGRNPDYRNGQPYAFNITLDHPLAPTFDLLRRGQSILDDLLRRLLRQRP